MIMKKSELVELIKDVFLYVGEWESKLEDKDRYPRVVYSPYNYSGNRASGGTYEKNQLIQVSIYSKRPTFAELETFENILIENGINVDLNIEFIETERTFHIFTAVLCER